MFRIRKLTAVFLIFICFSSLTACTLRKFTPVEKKNFVGSSNSESMSGKFSYLHGDTVKGIGSLKQGSLLKISYYLNPEAGDLTVYVADEKNRAVTEELRGADEAAFSVPEDGKYQIVVSAKEARGFYSVSWHVD